MTSSILQTDDTIAAIASARGGALRGVIRISGPEMHSCLSECFSPATIDSLNAVDQPTVVEGLLKVDSALSLPCSAYLWPTSRSYTRQFSAELHMLGVRPLLDAALNRICDSGARIAQPGEFTMRAFLAGRMDLTQAEAVLGVIDAADQQELGVALTQLAGGLAAPLNRLRDELLDLLAHVEAGLDFVEEDISFISAEQLDVQLQNGESLLTEVLEKINARMQHVAEIQVALVGWPNVGKSSLMNALAGASNAIVSDVAGTTRDYVAATIDCDGIPVRFVDTAGFEAHADNNGLAGMAQDSTRDQATQSHLELLCLDATRPLNAWERQQLAMDEHRRINVLTKADGIAVTDFVGDAVVTSSVNQEGLDELKERLRSELEDSLSTDSAVVGTTASRCRDSLRQAAEALKRARKVALIEMSEELVAAEVREALDALGSVVGAVYTDDILDRVFSRFCIGK